MPHETPAQKRKIHTVMHEYKTGALKTGRSDKKVRSRKQAVAIAMGEAGVPRRSAVRRK
ncbi:MAG: DUF6496 domain-containing protein [Elusimicrobia bacterium]|nr:DUF6496 domain-containing protein [Elusimicrobiota bacterium]